MKDIKDMNLAECLQELRQSPDTEDISDRIDTLLFEQAQRHDAWVDALENRVNSLEAERRWIPVSERMPTEADGDAEGYVFVHGVNAEGSAQNDIDLWHNLSIWNGKYWKDTHWKRITPPEDKP